MSEHGHVILAFDGEDPAAGGRRAAARPAHLAVISRWAAAGRLALGVPLFRADGAIAGSLLVLAREDELGVKEYLADEPFAREGVWARYDAIPFRLAELPYAPLPYAPLPTGGPVPGATTPPGLTHVVTLAWDGEDADAPARRLAARAAHFARVDGFAADGTLALGGAILDTGGAMRGSLAVTRHGSVAEAEAFWADDPYVQQGVWRRAERWPTRIAPLPYRPLSPSGAP